MSFRKADLWSGSADKLAQARWCIVLIWFLTQALAPSNLLAQTASFQSHQTKVALVVGVGRYEHVTALRNPTNDATAMSAALERMGFEVISVEDPTRLELEEAIREYEKILPQSDIASFYYAGHSIQIDGENYLIPTDAVLSTEAEVGNFLMRSADITNLMDQHASVRITILDACRDNPFIDDATSALSSSPRSISRGLAAFPAPFDLREGSKSKVYGSVVAYATAPGLTADDGGGRNSPYTEALLNHIEQPGLEIGRMFRNVAAEVLQSSGGEQQPEYLVRLTDEVYFKVPEPNQCDLLAAAPYNSIGVAGVDFERINHADAIPACITALEEDLEHPRHQYNLGRAYDAAGNFEKAVELYRMSSAQGYAAAMSSLGVMHINGQGTRQNFKQGVELLQAARSLGSRTAKISLTYSDFTVLFETQEFKSVQQKLKGLGYYSGGIDGDFGPSSKIALANYQEINGLIEGGLTLETLASLGLIDVIPAYELN